MKKTNEENKISRRDFIRKSGVSIGSLIVLPSHILFSKKEIRDASGKVIQKAVVSPNDKVNLACCGVGNRGASVVRDLYATGAANVVALCDINIGGKKTLKTISNHKGANQFQDFRAMFDYMGNQIDAVSVATPDFSHFPITILAMSFGKHVYVEKPLTRTFEESEMLIRAAKKFNVATQMGNQGH